MIQRMKGLASIARITSSGTPETFVRFELEDVTSHTRALVVDISLEAFGRLLSGLSSIPVEFELTAERVGLRHEHKTEAVPVPDYTCSRCTEQELSAILRPFEVDGWKAYAPDLLNGHRHECINGEHFQRVTFHRYVKGE